MWPRVAPVYRSFVDDCCGVWQTGLSHACASGFMPILELLATVSDDVDPNLSDNDGNTPLIFAAQAGQCGSAFPSPSFSK